MASYARAFFFVCLENEICFLPAKIHLKLGLLILGHSQAAKLFLLSSEGSRNNRGNFCRSLPTIERLSCSSLVGAAVPRGDHRREAGAIE